MVTLKRLFRPFALSAYAVSLALLTACGSESPDLVLEQAKKEQAAENFEVALAGFEKVLASEAADGRQKFQALREGVVCTGNVNGDDQATEMFDWLVQDHADRLDIDTLVYIGTKLGSAGCSEASLGIVKYADDRYAKSDPAAKAKLATLAEKLAAAGDDETNAALKALGYVGE